jgi:hypothetical protein
MKVVLLSLKHPIIVNVFPFKMPSKTHWRLLRNGMILETSRSREDNTGSI